MPSYRVALGAAVAIVTEPHATLPIRRAGIDTYRQPVPYLHAGCTVCRAGGFAALTRVKVRCGEREVVAVLNVVTGEWLDSQEAAPSDAAWRVLDPAQGAIAEFSYAEPPESASALRAKVFGMRLGESDIAALMRDSEVDVSVPDVDVLRGRTPVLADDIVSSGATLIETVAHLRRLGLPPPLYAIIHAVFAGDAYRALQDAGVAGIVSTDSIGHPSNAIGLPAAIADAVAGHLVPARQPSRPG